MRKGKGRYRDTHIVTFAPRYLLDNRSTHKLAFAQREFAKGKVRRLQSLKVEQTCCSVVSIKVYPGLSIIVFVLTVK